MNNSHDLLTDVKGILVKDFIPKCGLPYFKENMMYKEMEVGKHYTLKELGL